MSAGIVASGGHWSSHSASLSLIIYGVATETSIVRLFMAGVIPGLLLALGMYIIIIIAASRVPSLVRGKFDVSILVTSTVAAIPGLGMPVLVLGGLYGGLLPQQRRPPRHAVMHWHTVSYRSAVNFLKSYYQ